jgi:hypothetical protein
MNWLLILIAALLPTAGTKFKELPPGPGKAAVESSCYACHSADLLAQQRLTEKQWTASVEKMMRWGADVSPQSKPVIIEYLSRHYGPGNVFVPTAVAPVK